MGHRAPRLVRLVGRQLHRRGLLVLLWGLPWMFRLRWLGPGRGLRAARA